MKIKQKEREKILYNANNGNYNIFLNNIINKSQKNIVQIENIQDVHKTYTEHVEYFVLFRTHKSYPFFNKITKMPEYSEIKHKLCIMLIKNEVNNGDFRFSFSPIMDYMILFPEMYTNILIRNMNYNSKECPICFDKIGTLYELNKHMTGLKCGHNVCNVCYKRLNACPICRIEI